MNRLVLIGNGFDLAHGLKTSYADFINWYWDQRMFGFNNDYSDVSEDILCSFRILNDKREDRETWSTLAFAHNYFRSIPALGKEYVGKDIIASIIEDTDHFETKFSPFFERITHSIETKGWVDIENEYYDLLKSYSFPSSSPTPNKESIAAQIKTLNEQLAYLKKLLIQYLEEATKDLFDRGRSIKNAIYAPFKKEDMSIEGEKLLDDHLKYWENQKTDDALEEKIGNYGYELHPLMSPVTAWREKRSSKVPPAFMLPDDIMCLNFNYTNTILLYITEYYRDSNNHIHGNIKDLKSIIFGYGDELDDDFQKLKESNIPGCLQNVKSIRYLEAPNYRRVLSFIESAPFQVLIMGHSCGNSDRTLLNTIFEHKNCVSIKPYYYRNAEKGTDNYLELVQNISRNFTDMQLMRARVVNKTQCEPLVHD